MAVEITKETQKFKWNTNSQTFQAFTKPWNEAERAKVNAKISDACKFTDCLKKGSVVKKGDAIRVYDWLCKNFILVPRENILITEWVKKVARIMILTKIRVVEKDNNHVNIPFLETFRMIERRNNSNSLNNIEVIKLMEVYCDYISFIFSVVENIFIKDKPNRETLLLHTEHLTTGDSLTRSELHVTNEKIVICDRYGDVVNFTRLISECAKVCSSQSISLFHNQKEILHISDLKANNLVKKPKETFTVSELFKKDFLIARKIYETINVADKAGKSSKISKKELLNIIDAFIRACEGVLSDVIIQKGGITLEEFLAAVEAPSLHQPFTEFKVGEYEYKDALVRVVLQSTSRDMNPSITACTMNVDIPDTDDRGTVKITNTSTATKVHFNRFYYNAPEVVVTLIGGSTSNGTVIPNIVSTELQDDEGRYFEVELLKTDGSRTTGTISWASKGY